LDKPVRMIMSSEVRTVAPDEEVESVAVMMTEHRIRHVPVLQDGALAGIVSIGDVVKSRIGRARAGPRRVVQVHRRPLGHACGNLRASHRVAHRAGHAQGGGGEQR